MIPKKLILEGFLSYKNKTEIDFDLLIQDNVFGIFGPIGSGKSSILDAICFALFDSNYRGLNHEELISLGKNELYVEFHFKHQNDIYCIIKRYKNGKKASLYKNRSLVHDNITAIKNEIQNLINLDYKKFIKTVIIPQGTYQNLLIEEDYYGILKEYLGIPEITIPEKINVFKKNLENLIKEKNAILAQYDNVNLEIIENLENENQNIIFEIDKLIVELEKKQLELKNKETIFKNFEEFNQIQNKFNDHILNQDKFLHLKNETLKQERIYINFKDLYNEKNRLHNDIKVTEQKINDNSIILNQLTSTLQLKLEELEKLESQSEFINGLETHLKDLQVLKNILFVQESIKNLENDNHEIELKIQEDLKKLDFLHSKLKKKLFEKETIENELNIYNMDLIKQIKIQNENLKKYFYEIELISDNIQKHFPNFLNISYQDFQKYLMKMELEKQSLKISIELLNLSIELQEGVPCKLCGSTHHPTPLKIEDSHQLNNEYKRLHKLSENLKENFLKYSNLNYEYEWILHDLDTQSSLTNLNEFWKNEDFENQLNNILLNYDNNSKKLKEIELFCQNEEKQFTKLETEIHGRKQLMKSNQDKIKNLENKIEDIKQTFNNPNIETSIYSDDALNKEISTIENQIQNHKSSKIEIEKKINELKLEHSKIDSEQNLLRKNLEKHKNSLDIIEKDLNDKFLTFENINFEMIANVLSNYDHQKIEKSKKLIAEYETLKNEYQKELQKAQEKVKNQEPIEKIEIDNLENEQKNLINILENKKQLKVQKDTELLNLKEIWRKKELIQKELTGLVNKKSIIDDLSKSSVKDEFKNFIVEMYLEEFRREVNQTLRLLNQGDFELVKEFKEQKTMLFVEDHRNGGIKRSLKSLSGGQSFLTSFAIGLTISNQIKNNHSENFFFIDEGFGTLDSESLQQVKQLIFQLRNQNRIIGIITHVNELQECITQKIILERKNDGTKVNYL